MFQRLLICLLFTLHAPFAVTQEPPNGTLEQIVAADPDISKVAEALGEAHRQALAPLLEQIQKRIAAEKARAGTAESIVELARLEEQYAVYANGTNLPAFLREPPAVFQARPSRQKTLRFVAFGDFGDGQDSQRKVASALRTEHRKHRFELGLTLGDNFYPIGMTSPQDERWTSQWENLYAPLKINFYASLGNHDWYHPDSPAAETLYSLKSRSWHMPATYYSYTAGPVQFFALDTGMQEDGAISEKQLLWLRDALAASTARWKIAYAHHPIYSGSREDNGLLLEKLLPVLRDGKVDAYLAGHDHVMAHLRPEHGILFFVAGGGGSESYDVRTDNSRLLFGKSAHGFLTVDVNSEELRFRFLDENARELYAHTARKAR